MEAVEIDYATRFAELYGYEFNYRDGVIILSRSGVVYESFNDQDDFYDFISKMSNE